MTGVGKTNLKAYHGKQKLFNDQRAMLILKNTSLGFNIQFLFFSKCRYCSSNKNYGKLPKH